MTCQHWKYRQQAKLEENPFKKKLTNEDLT